MTKKLNIAIVGATGLVGRKMIEVLEERNLPIENVVLLASKRSAGQKIKCLGKEIEVQELTETSFDGVDIALFSAGGTTSKIYSSIAAKSGCIVIDNSSAFRMHPNAPLVVPEVNSDALKNHHGIIANPNCSTIQLMVALKPIKEVYGLKRVICSTYQSISGAGQTGVSRLHEELANKKSNVDGKRIAFNTLFHPFEDDSTNEENKMVNESRKILSDENLKISVTCVRLPVLGGHSESVNIQTENSTSADEIRNLLSKSEGIIILDDTKNDVYPTPMDSDNKDEVFIGRIRKDESADNAFNLWVVSDNLRKGAATNAVQIAEKIIELNAFEYEKIDF